MLFYNLETTKKKKEKKRKKTPKPQNQKSHTEQQHQISMLYHESRNTTKFYGVISTMDDQGNFVGEAWVWFNTL